MDAPSLRAHNEVAITSANGMTSLRRPGDRGERIDLSSETEPVVTNDSPAPPVPPAARWWHPFRIAAVGLFVWLVVLACVMGLPTRLARLAGLLPPQKGPPFKVSPETTLITEPLDRHGWPDYVTSVDLRLREGVTPASNLAIELRALLPPYVTDLGQQAQYDERLGFSTNESHSPPFIKVEHALPHLTMEARRKIDWTDRSFCQEHVWTRAEFPLLAQWIDVNRECLDRLLACQHRTCCYFPRLRSDTSASSDLWSPLASSTARSFGFDARVPLQLALARSCCLDHPGFPITSLKDIDAVRRIAVLRGRHQSKLEQLQVEGYDKHAIWAIVGLLNSGYLGDGDLLFLQEQGRTLPPIPPVYEMFDGLEPLELLDELVHMARIRRVVDSMKDVNATSYVESLDRCLRYGPINWNIVLADAVDATRQQVAIARIESLPERLRRQDTLIAEMKTRSAPWSQPVPATVRSLMGRPDDNGHVVAACVLEGWLKFNRAIFVTSERRVTMARMLPILIQLKRWQLRFGSFPATLAQLRSFAPEVPLQIADPFLDGPDLIYRVFDGECRLYSVGPNGRDDGGVHDSLGDDVAFRLSNIAGDP